MNAPYSIRRATPQDADLLANLGATCFSRTFGYLYSQQNLSSYLAECFGEAIQRAEIEDPYNTFFIAESAGRAVGYAKLARCKMPIPNPVEPAMELHRLYLLEDSQSQGIGAALMQSALDEARSMHAASVYLSVWENNHRGQKFYRRFGFRKIDEYEYYVGEHIDNEWIMELIL